MTFGEYIDGICAGTEGSYLGNRDMSQQIPALRNDILFPECYLHKSLSRVNYWFGPKGTLTHLHRDFSHNLFAQIQGRKHFLLFSPHKSHRLNPCAV